MPGSTGTPVLSRPGWRTPLSSSSCSRRPGAPSSLASRITLAENIADGVAPAFQAEGFVKPPVVQLISAGKLADALVSPRSAKEYGLATNAANSGESPESLDMAAGSLAERDVLQSLDTGLYISNLWY